MRRVFIKKIVMAGVFVIILSSGAVLSVSKNFKELNSSVKQGIATKESVSTIISNVDAIINENAYGKYSCIEAYGYLQHLLDKKEENNFEVIKDQQGSLHLSYFETKVKDTSGLALEVAKLQKSLAKNGTKLLYVMTPDKYIKGETTMEPGLPYNYANETADAFLQELTKLGVDSFDYREMIGESGIPANELFYQTDHHWTTQTAFWAFRELIQELSEKYGLAVPNLQKYTDLQNYNSVTYKNSFLGSLGRKTGSLYAGIDDYTLMYPKFETSYSFSATTYDNTINTEGRFEEALLNLGALGTSAGKYEVESDRYYTYLYGNQGILHITNRNMVDGPKILLVKDSYMVPVAAFLSTICSDVYLVDPRYYEGNISEYASSIKGLDYALISFYPQNLTEEFFRLNETIK